MARKPKKAVPEPVFTRRGVRLEASEVRVEAGVNIDARHPKYGLSCNEEDPVYTRRVSPVVVPRPGAVRRRASGSLEQYTTTKPRTPQLAAGC
jgi:hypothetical protein